MIDLGLGDEGRVAGDVGEHKSAFAQAGEELRAVGLACHHSGELPVDHDVEVAGLGVRVSVDLPRDARQLAVLR